MSNTREGPWIHPTTRINRERYARERQNGHKGHPQQENVKIGPEHKGQRSREKQLTTRSCIASVVFNKKKQAEETPTNQDGEQESNKHKTKEQQRSTEQNATNETNARKPTQERAETRHKEERETNRSRSAKDV